MKKIIIYIFLAFCPVLIQAQELGAPYLKVFSPNDYLSEPQNWSAAQDYRGVTYIANGGGLLEFDGNSWRKYRNSSKTIIRRVKVAESGIIYVGGDSEFGLFAPKKNGELEYYNLTEDLNTSIRNKRYGIHHIHLDGPNVYFISTKAILKYTNVTPGKKNIPTKVIYPKINFYACFSDGSELYMKSGGVGVVKIKGDTVQLVKNGKALKRVGIRLATPFNGKFLVSLRNKLVFLNQSSIIEEQEDTIQSFETQADSLLSHGITDLIKISENQIAVATDAGGIVIINSDGTITDHINKYTNLKSDRAYNTMFDGKNLWALMSKGIVNVELASPYRFWDYDTGIPATIYDIVRFRDTLFVCSSSGVYFLTKNRNFSNSNTKGISSLKKIGKYSETVWCQFVDSINFKEPKLLVSTTKGIHEISNGKMTFLLRPGRTVYNITYSRENPEILLLGTQDGIVSLQVKNGKYEILGKYEQARISGRYVAEDKKGNIWYCTGNSGIYKIKLLGEYPQKYSFDSIRVEKYDTTHGLSEVSENKVYYYKDQLVFLTTEGIKKFNYEKKTFEPDNKFGKKYANGNYGIFRFAPFGKEIFIRMYNDEHEWTERLTEQTDGTFLKDTTAYHRMDKFNGNSLYYENNGMLWTGGSEGLYRLDTKNTRSYTPIYSCIIRKVTAGADSVIFGGTYYGEIDGVISRAKLNQPDNQKYQLKFEDNTLSFFYALPFYEKQEAVKYSYKLEGFEDNWSEWSVKSEKQYTNLPKGTYRFVVRAINGFGEISSPSKYKFSILSPWYQTIWAYIAYIVLGGGILYFSIKLYTRKLQKEKDKLEEIVLERTTEITQQSEEIQAQADNLLLLNEDVTKKNSELHLQKAEIEQQHSLIKSSLKYAQTIQKAILPVHKNMSKYFDYFLIFKPKDIVSGDFYWYAHLPANNEFSEKLFIAAVDCTGHGVPGAFMSMIGNRILNELVNEKKITNPKDILINLDKGVVKALKQDISDNRDGMDISLCCIEYNTDSSAKITYAGAKRPLFIVRQSDKKLERVKGTNKSIGGILQTRSKVIFSNTEIKLTKGDIIYLSTDGYIDQNNKERTRLGTLRFSKIINRISQLPLETQKQELEEILEKHMKDTKQRDDITLIGLKI